MFSERIREVRREVLRLTQTELAELLGVRTSTVSRWERGIYVPRLYHAKLLERLTGWVPAEFLRDTADEYGQEES